MSLPMWQITLRLEPLDPLGLPTGEQTITVTGRGRVDPGDVLIDPEGVAEWSLRWLSDLSGARALLTVLLGDALDLTRPATGHRVPLDDSIALTQARYGDALRRLGEEG